MIMFNFPIPSSSHLVSLSFFVHRSLNYSMDTITWNSAILHRGIPSHATRVHDSTTKLRTSLISPPSSKLSLSNSQSQQKPRRFRSHGATVRRPEVTCGVRQIDDSQFSDVVLKSDRPVLVEFVASWCGPCRLMAPAIDWLAQEYEDRIRVVKIDHDANPGLIEKYKVYGLPNFMVFKNGAEIPGSRREGAITKAKLKEYIDQLLVDSVSVT